MVSETDTIIKTINVEVAYAEPDKQLILPVNVDAGTTVGGAIVQSGIMMKFPELDIENSKVGIFGKMTKMTTVLQDADRVEIYRPLIADPKEVRRKRAAEGKATKKGGSTGDA
ncbi:MAG: RnfH family protein [Gammaproteobacteria bacterium]|nr:RnfH family protein [Gammaproteobacteria bacterium]MCK5263482.1 RnfH family protein [Gammaproteobacteria bacterium]